jgi:hypothetical protein
MPEAANPFAQLASAPPPPAAAPLAKPLAQSTPAMSEPERLYKADYDRLTAQDPYRDYRDPNQVLRRAPDGTITATPRAGDQPAPGEPPRPGEPPQPGDQPPQPPRTDGGKIKLAEGVELTEQELRDLVAHKAQTDSQKLSTPKPNEYQIKFNDDFVLPQGVDWRWNEADPLLAQVRDFASTNNMTQDTFSKLLGLHAASQMKDMQEFAAAKAAEVQKLGDTANARVDAVKTWLKAMAPDHFAGLARVLEMAPSAATVRGLEALMHRYTTQGGGSYNGAHREPIIPGKVSDAEYSKMSYAERIEYASRFLQQPGGR